MKTLKTFIPEIYFFFAILYYWSLTSATFNWFAIGLIAVLGILIVTKNKVLGILFSVIISLLTLFLILALISEFREFETFNSEAKKLLGFGLLFFGVNLIFSAFMLYKYASKTTINKLNVSNNTIT